MGGARRPAPTPTLTHWLSDPVAELLNALALAAGAFGPVQRLPRERAQPAVDEFRAAIVTAHALQLNAELQAEVTDRRAWPIAGSVLEATGALVAELDPDKGRHCGACPFAGVASEESTDHC